MQVRFIMIVRAWGYNFPRYTTLHYKVLTTNMSTRSADSGQSIHFCVLTAPGGRGGRDNLFNCCIYNITIHNLVTNY